MKNISLITASGIMAVICAAASACSQTSPPAKQVAATAGPAAPAIPAEIQIAADNALGTDTDVLLFGDLAKNGHQQILAVNRVKATPQTAMAGILVMRLAVLENEAGTWKEIFRCDDHLKNTKGFMGGTPLSPVTGWRLQHEQDAEKGLEMYFTPMAKPAGGYIQTIGVRWNPANKRYQSLDRNFDQFLGEVPALDTPQSQLHQ